MDTQLNRMALLEGLESGLSEARRWVLASVRTAMIVRAGFFSA
jgi:hypothetical protein